MKSKLYAVLRLAVRGMMPKPPLLDSNKIHELELHGVDSVRALLASWRKNPISLGNVVVACSEIEDWLKWKAAQDARWMKVGVVAAVVAAIFSLVTAVFSLVALLK
jgi:hypothetical protein